MAIRVRLDPIAADFRVLVDSAASVKAQQKAIANFARAEIAKADAVNRRALGRAPDKTVTVDGRQNAALETVKPNGGVIIAEWEIAVDAIQWIRDELVDRSPRRSGDYIAGHKLFADGAPVTGAIPVAREYLFVNLVPYARKIEVGKTESGRAFVIQVPNRIYQRTAEAARARFGRLVAISFTYRDATGGYRAPAIIVRLKGN